MTNQFLCLKKLGLRSLHRSSCASQDRADWRNRTQRRNFLQLLQHRFNFWLEIKGS